MMETVPEIHTEGGLFKLDLVDDPAPVNARRWRIILGRKMLQVVLFDDAGNEYNSIQIERVGTQPQITRGGVKP